MPFIRTPDLSKDFRIQKHEHRLGSRATRCSRRSGSHRVHAARCHLCDEAKAAITPLLREFHSHLREVNIDLDAELAEKYGWDIPVVFIGRHKAAKHRVDLTQFRRQLQEAQQKA